jgi:hypothetical protein
MALAASGVNAAAASTQSRVVLSGTAYESDFGFIDKGATATDMTVTDNIYLPVRDPGALAAEADAVSTPGTHAYGKYISSEQVKDENQLGPAQVALVRDWLSAAGLTVSQPNCGVGRDTVHRRYAAGLRSGLPGGCAAGRRLLRRHGRRRSHPRWELPQPPGRHQLGHRGRRHVAGDREGRLA